MKYSHKNMKLSIIVICIEDINFFKKGNEYTIRGTSCKVDNPKLSEYKLESENGHFYWRSSEYFVTREEYRNNEITNILK